MRKQVRHFSWKVFLGNLLIVFLFGVVMILTRPAQAAQAPDYIFCKEPDRYSHRVCMSESRPDAMERYVYTDDRGVKRVETVRSTVGVFCKGGVCEDNVYREYRGDAPNGYYRIYLDYMLTVDSQGRTFAYHHSVDPRGAESANTVPKVKEGVYDVWCNPMGDTCTYGDREYSREELVNHIPKARVNAESGPGWDCLSEFCMDSNSDVIGLNPFYWAYQ